MLIYFLTVIDISTVAQGVGFTEGGCHGTGGGQDVTPGIVSVGNNGSAGGVDDSNHITLNVSVSGHFPVYSCGGDNGPWHQLTAAVDIVLRRI